MQIIDVVTDEGEIRQFDTEAQKLLPRASQKPTACHCELEPMKIWFCCLLAGSQCPCQQKEMR